MSDSDGTTHQLIGSADSRNIQVPIAEDEEMLSGMSPDSGGGGYPIDVDASPDHSVTDEHTWLTRHHLRRRVEIINGSAPANRSVHRARSVTPPRTSLSSGFLSSGSSTTIFPDAPDGGYGWVIVFAAFMIHFIADGVSFSFGVMYPTIQEVFDVGKGASGMVASVFLALPLLAAPLSSAIIDRYGCRPTIICGGFLSAFGVFISRWAPNIGTLYLTFGLIAGLGLSFTFNGSIVAVTYYFDKRRSMATGLTVTGTGIGTCVFAPLIEFLLNEYHWDGTLLILSAILLNQVVFGVIIRDLEWPEDTLEYKRERFLRKLDEHVAAHVQDDSPSMTYSRVAGSRMDNRVIDWTHDEHVRMRRCISLMELPVFMRARVETLEMAPEIKRHQAQLPLGDQNRSKSMATIKKHPATGTIAVDGSGPNYNSPLVPDGINADERLANARAGFLMPTLAEVQQLKEQARAHRRQRMISQTQSHYSAEDVTSCSMAAHVGAGARHTTGDDPPMHVTGSGPTGQRATFILNQSPEPPYSDGEVERERVAPTMSPIRTMQRLMSNRATSVDVGELPELLLGAEVQEQRYMHGGQPSSLDASPRHGHQKSSLISNGRAGGQGSFVVGDEDGTLMPTSPNAITTADVLQESLPVGADAEHVNTHGIRERRVKQRAARPNAQTVVARPHAATLVRYRDLPPVPVPDEQQWLTREILHARFFSAPALFKHRHRRRAPVTGCLANFKEGVVDAFWDQIDLLRSVSFVLLLLSSFLLYMFYDIIYVNVPEHMVEQGKTDDEHASYILSVIGIVNTVGMASYGFIADSKRTNRVILYGCSNLVCGVCVLAFIFDYFDNFYSATTVCAIFGWFISANYVLGSVIILDIMSMSDFISAYGMIGLFEGIGTLIGPALAGYLYDWTGSYQATFISGGVGIIMSGFFILIIPPFKKCVRYCRTRLESPHVEFVDAPPAVHEVPNDNQAHSNSDLTYGYHSPRSYTNNANNVHFDTSTPRSPPRRRSPPPQPIVHV